MTLPRRQFLQLAAGAAALPALSRTAWAQAYPARPVHLIVTFPAGSAPDIIARLPGNGCRSGSASNSSSRTGRASAAISPPNTSCEPRPDGYTLLMPVSTNAVNATLHPNLSFNFIRDIAPVAGIANTPFVILVPPSFPAKTVPELIAYCQSQSGQDQYGLGRQRKPRRISSPNCSRS